MQNQDKKVESEKQAKMALVIIQELQETISDIVESPIIDIQADLHQQELKDLRLLRRKSSHGDLKIKKLIQNENQEALSEQLQPDKEELKNSEVAVSEQQFSSKDNLQIPQITKRTNQTVNYEEIQATISDRQEFKNAWIEVREELRLPRPNIRDMFIQQMSNFESSQTEAQEVIEAKAEEIIYNPQKKFVRFGVENGNVDTKDKDNEIRQQFNNLFEGGEEQFQSEKQRAKSVRVSDSLILRKIASTSKLTNDNKFKILQKQLTIVKSEELNLSDSGNESDGSFKFSDSPRSSIKSGEPKEEEKEEPITQSYLSVFKDTSRKSMRTKIDNIMDDIKAQQEKERQSKVKINNQIRLKLTKQRSVKLDNTLLKNKVEWDARGNMKKPKVSNHHLDKVIKILRQKTQRLSQKLNKRTSIQDIVKSIELPRLQNNEDRKTTENYSSQSSSSTSSQYIQKFRKNLDSRQSVSLQQIFAIKSSDKSLQLLIQKKIENKKQIKRLLYEYFDHNDEKQKKDFQINMKLHEQNKIKRQSGIENTITNYFQTHFNNQANDLLDIKPFKSEKGDQLDYSDVLSRFSQESDAIDLTKFSLKTIQDDEKEHQFLDLVIDEYINLPMINYLYFKNKRDDRIKTSKEFMELEDKIKSQYIPFFKDLKFPRSKPKEKQKASELKCKEIQEELIHCPSYYEGFKDAMKQEFHQNKAFQPIHAESLKLLQNEIKNMNDRFNMQIKELQEKIKKK